MTVESLKPKRIVAASVALILGTSALCQRSLAADAEGPNQAGREEEIEEVTVTGSHIRRRDLETSSPLVTISQETFENISNVAVEAALNKLPQFVPGLDQFDTADVQLSAVSTVGSTNLNLRNLGANRNLVLINGRRAVPLNATMSVDTNSIPSAALSRVEIITGGASSAYGADAVGGVVNFILKDNFQGVSFDAQFGQTELDDGSELRASGLLGGNFGEGRGNAMFGLDYTKRGQALQIDRGFYRDQLTNPYTNGTAFNLGFTQYSPVGGGFGNNPSQAAVDALFSQRPPGSVMNNSSFSVHDGRVFVGSDADGAYRYNGPFGLKYKLSDTGTLSENSTIQRLSSPLDRYSLFGSAHFDLTDQVTVYTQATFSQSETEQVLDFVQASGTWGALIPHGTGRNCQSIGITSGGCQDTDPVTDFGAPYMFRPTLPQYVSGGTAGLNCGPFGGCSNSQAFPVPAELAALLDSRPNPNAPWALNRELDFLDSARGTLGETTNYQLIFGFKGKLPVRDWTWDTYISHGTSRSNNVLQGVASWSRYRAVVGSPNYGRAASLQGNSGNPGNGGNAASATCTSGLPIFDDFAVSADCELAIGAELNNLTEMDQTMIEGVLQGGLFDMPAGALRYAVGTTYRKNQYSFAPDLLLSQGSFVDGAIGLDPIGGVTADDNVREAYAELLIPLLRDRPLFTHLNLELGYRYSDYRFEGKVSTYKALADWAITPDVRIRGGYQRANRAPNLGELFQPQTDSLSVGPGDPCGLLFAGDYGVNPATNREGAAGAARVRALCVQLMGPAGATFYNFPAFPSFGFEFARTTGNSELESEVADTYTAGIVVRSPFESPAARFTTSLDWFRLKVSDAINPQSLFTVYEHCFSEEFNETLSPTDPFCQQLPRNQQFGFAGRPNITYENSGLRNVEGFDYSFNWGASVADLGVRRIPGFLSLAISASYNLHDERQDSPDSPVQDWTGFAIFGNFRWQAFTSLSYSMGGLNSSLRWRHYPSVHNFARLNDPDTLTQGVGSYNIYDLSAGYAVSRNVFVRVGIDNLFDVAPPVNGFNPGVSGPGSDGYSPGQLATGFVYDALGRRYYMGVSVNF